jgi:hypothetical protein
MPKIFRQPGLAALLVVLSCVLPDPVNAAGGVGYAPVALDRLTEVFPQKCLLDSDAQEKSFTSNGIKGEYGEFLVIKGSTKQGKNWTLKLSPVAQIYEVWEGDFDRNGQPDLAILSPTGGCGYACSSRVIFVMFDANRKPRIFEGFSTGLSSKKPPSPAAKISAAKIAPVLGIQTIFKSGNGQAIVVLQSLEHAPKSERSYWRTAAWQATNSTWIEQHNVCGAHLPSYVSFTDRPNHRPSQGKDSLGKDAASTISEITKAGELESGEEFKF